MNIYVGNLNWGMTSDDLYNLFAPYGEVVSAKIVTDKFNNNRSKGFGFVEMGSDEEAQSAINMFNGADFGGRKLTVNVARPLEPRAPGMNRRLHVSGDTFGIDVGEIDSIDRVNRW